MTAAEIDQLIFSELEQRAALMDYPLAEISEKTDFVRSGLYDSMSFIDLVVSLEEKTGTEIDLERISPQEIATPASLRDMILKLRHA